MVKDKYRKSFFKSKEGTEAFKEVGLEYRSEMWDQHYDDFLQKIRRTPEKDRVRKIQTLKRVVLTEGEESEQYIVHDLLEEGKDPLGNVKAFYRGGIGCFHIPIPKYVLKVNDDGDKERVTSGIEGLKIGYSIPFTKENIERISKYVTKNTQFVIALGNQGSHTKRITVNTLEDLKLGEAEELVRFGHRASDYEKQVLADEKQGKYQHYTPPLNPGRQYG
jgi:hypothetical protein